MTRIVLTGSESTGKSTLAAQLAEHFHAPLVPEFLRAYAAERGGRLGLADVDAIARGQIELEDRVALGHVTDSTSRPASDLLILDTDLLSAVVYNHHYYGECPAWIDEAARTRAADLYLLLDIDAPWIPDPLRDRGSQREEMQRLFRGALEERELSYVSITGSWEQRRRLAIAAIKKLLEPSFRFQESS